jgi:hypothetical protein
MRQRTKSDFVQSISRHGHAVSRLGNVPYLAVLQSLDLLLPQSALHFACKRVGCAGTAPILEGLQSCLARESMETRGKQSPNSQAFQLRRLFAR